MKFATIAALAASAFAAPLTTRDAASDTDLLVLQFALTLEHLEDYFYSHALRNANLTKSKFLAAGYDEQYYNNLRYITDDEKSHVGLLTTAIKALGASPVLECEYNFQFDTVQNFVTLSSILEGVGTSAYLGGAPLITNKNYLTVAGSILVTEALHTSLQRDALKEVPFATPYGTPLDPNSVYTLAAAFITKCPDRSTKLPFVPYPTLAVKGASTQPIKTGTVVTFTVPDNVSNVPYLTFVSGLNVISVAATKVDGGYSAAVPAGDTGVLNLSVAGQVYVLATQNAASNNQLSTAGTVIAGPAIIEVAPAAPRFLGAGGNFD